QSGYAEMEATVPPAELAERKETFRKKLLDEMLAEVLIKDRADRLGLTVTKPEIDDAIKRLMSQYNLQTEEAFNRSIEQSGLTRAEMESRLRDTLLTQKVFGRELRSRTEIDDKELRKRYEREKDAYRLPERARVREIVIVLPERADLAARALLRARAEDAATRARSGEAFEALVKEFSDSPSKEKGGDIGVVSKGELLGPLDQAVFAAAAGSVAGPVETPAGFHLLLVEERLPSEIPGFEAVKERLRNSADQETFNRDYLAYIEKLRKEAYVQVFETNLPPS
ncbi:MAG TPA: peptidyl-prolyl cis-trans isomerase, partial [Thermoanaerobaculia bacterium]|nr:peptidyl-prolyl cis-trans isomerase [Thermoanaerobaculia bacterium]